MKNRKVITRVNFEKAKQLAKKLKKHDNIPHCEALDLTSAILGFDSWENLVSTHKNSYRKLKNESILFAYDVKDAIEIQDWRLFPAVTPAQKILEANSKQWSHEGLTSAEQSEHIMTQYISFYLNPLIENISLVDLEEILSEISFFFPLFIWVNNSLVELDEIVVDIQSLLNYHIETFG